MMPKFLIISEQKSEMRAGNKKNIETISTMVTSGLIPSAVMVI